MEARSAIRRLGPVAVVFAIVLTACAGRGPIGASPAAQVGDRTVSMADLDRYRTAAHDALIVLEREEPGQIMPDAAERFFGEHTPRGIPAEGVRSVLGELVQREILRTVADEIGAAVGDAELEAVRAQLPPEILEQLPEAYTDVIVEVEALAESIGAVTEIDDDLLRSVYDDQKASYTQVCINALAVTGESSAADAASRLRDGEPFETVHEELDELPDTDGLGGEMPCQAAADLEPNLGPTIYDLRVGDVPDPLRIDDDLWMVFVIREVDEPTFEDLAPQLAPFAAELHVEARIRALFDRVRINPRFGAWNTETGQIDPIPTDARTIDFEGPALDP